MMDWTAHSWIIVTIGFLTAVSCSVLGVFLVLRKMSMVADAISHAVLPGIVIAFLISGSRDPLPMLLGAALIGALTTVFIEWLNKTGRIQSDAAIGIVFTTFFAIGVVLVSAKAGMVDLDQECVLYGEIAYAPWDELVIWGNYWGIRPLWILSVIAVLNLTFISLFFKELKITTFDPALATTLGISAGIMHYALMGLVSLTTVAAFESVGAILVVAMFVVPAATSYLLTDKLGRMIGITIGISALISIFGYWMARELDASIAGSMSTIAGLIFMIVFLFSPKYGFITRLKGRFALRMRIAIEDWAANQYRFIEHKDSEKVVTTNTDSEPNSLLIAYLIKLKGLGIKDKFGWKLTDKGMELAQEIVKRHRSWEGYLFNSLQIPSDHLHRSAHDVEHFIDTEHPDLQEVKNVGSTDPHGRPIPE